ncbi:MAG TPA: tetratricopeptide repeat protein, partial [Thermoanaerobaculia bacterium]|nr:tetratricopeptide repeat protein [Thermoanaerobaculia bacterium]
PKDSEAEGDAEVIGEWAPEELNQLWEFLIDAAQQVDHFYVVASCRYRNPSYAGALLPVSPLPPDALFRLMSWFPALRRLSLESRARLVERLAGHPRAVEYADDLLAHALAEWENRYGPWQGGDPEQEWAELVEPVLPKVRDKLQANLLLAEIWDRVLADRERQMLYRMTLLRRPWQWPLMSVLGEEGEGDEAVFTTAERLRRTSLLEQVEVITRVKGEKFAPVRHFILHPATVQLVRYRFVEEEAPRRAVHRRLGDYLEGEANTSHSIELLLEAGYHLFQAGEYDRALEVLDSASDGLQNSGRVREGLLILEPFLTEQTKGALAPMRRESLLGRLAQAYHRLGESDQTIEYGEQQMEIAREIGDREGEGDALMMLGVAYTDLGEVEKAITYCEQALVIHQQIGDRQGESGDLGNLGLGYFHLGKFEEAIGYFEQTLLIHREIGDRRGEGNDLGNLGLAYMSLHKIERAITHFEQRLGIAREIGDRRGEEKVLGNLGTAYMQLGKVATAIGYYEQALVIDREIGDRRGEAADLGNLGITYMILGETNKAVALLEQALAIGRAIKDPLIIRKTSAALESLRSGA